MNLPRGPLHNKGADGLCKECGEPFPCPTGLAIYESVKLSIEQPQPAPIQQPPPERWEDLDDHENRCPTCLHWWVSHGEAPDPNGCGAPTSAMDEHGATVNCGCPERPKPDSVWADPLAREAARQAQHPDHPTRTE